MPFVPVTAAISSCSVGRPKNSAAAWAMASRTSVTTICGTRAETGCVDDERGGAVLDRSRGIFVPVRALTRHAEEEGPRSHRAAVVGEVGDLDSRLAHDLDGCEGV